MRPRLSACLLLSLNLVRAPAHSQAVYVIETVAGADQALENAARLSVESINGLVVDRAGVVYLSDTTRHRILKLTPAGELSLVAGSGNPGFSGDGGPAPEADLNSPYGLARDASGALYVADLENARVRRIAPNGQIETVAGGGRQPVSAAGTPALAAALRAPRNLALTAEGDLLIADFADHRLLRLSPQGVLTPAAGDSIAGTTAAAMPATAARLRFPAGLHVDKAGIVWIADSGNHAIRQILGGLLWPVSIPFSEAYVNLPTAVAVEEGGGLLIASSGFDQLVRVRPGTVPQVLTRGAREVALDAAGNIYVASGPLLRKIAPSGQITTLLGGPSLTFRGEGTSALGAWFHLPAAVQLDAAGGLLIADTGNHRLRRVSPNGLVFTVAGTGEAGSAGDGGSARAAQLAAPEAIALGPAGDIYIADTGNHRVRRIDLQGQITTVAGSGQRGFNGEIRPALQAQLDRPSGIAVDATGVLFIADTGNHRIRRLGPDGVLATYAGKGAAGYAGDGGNALDALLSSPRGLCLDLRGNLYFADTGNHRVRRISPAGIIHTVAGTGAPGFSGDGQAAAAAQLRAPSAVAIDSQGNLYISDEGNHRIRKVTPDGIITTIAGQAEGGFAGDGSEATAALLDSPGGLAVDQNGNVYFADRRNHRIRKLSLLAAKSEPAMAPVRIVHAATLQPASIAPGMLVSLSGAMIGPANPVSGIVTRAGGVEIRFDGQPAPILYAQHDLINVQAPYRLRGRSATTIEVVHEGTLRARASVDVAEVSPGVFPVIVNEDATLNGPANPAPAGSLITFYATGEGAIEPAIPEGQFAEWPYPSPIAPIRVDIGAQRAELVSAWSAVTSPGVAQLVVRLPEGLPTGTHTLILTVGGAASRGVPLHIRQR